MRLRSIAVPAALLAIASLAACSSPAASSSSSAAAQTPAPQRTAGTAAECLGVFTADITAGAKRMQQDEASALAGGVPACDGLTRQKIKDAYAVAALLLPQLSASAPASPPAAPSSVPASSPPAMAGKTVATFSGSGIENTPQFTVTDSWKLSYSFDCSNFGSKGNFQIYEYAGSSLGGVLANDLAESKSASTMQYGDAGTHHLEVNSECAWHLSVVDEG
jgi:hypothetical protein